MGHHPTQLKTA